MTGSVGVSMGQQSGKEHLFGIQLCGGAVTELHRNGGCMKETILKRFAEVFGDAEGVKVYFAPGRVNLIGEHTDYNGGHVFPCALTIGTYAAARKRADRKL